MMVNNKIEDAVFDAVFAQALKDAFENEISTVEEKWGGYNYADNKRKKHEKNERKALREKERGHLDSYYYAVRAAVSLLIVFNLGFGMMMATPSVRAEAVNAAVKFFDRYLSFDFSGEPTNTARTGIFKLGYIPNGYMLSDSFETEAMSSYTFKDGGGAFSFTYGFSDSYTPQYDAENTEVKKDHINETEVYFIINKQKGGKNAAIWSGGAYAFSVSGNLPISEIKKIIEEIS